MSVREWFAGRELFLTGASSELGRSLLEKILRCLPDVKVYVLLRTKDKLDKDDRIKCILQTPRFERLRQENPNAVNQIRMIEGNLIYDNLGMSKADKASLSNVTVAFHAGGPHEAILDFAQSLPKLQAMVAAINLFRHRGKITESPPLGPVEGPLVMVRIPCIGPAYREPMPGLVERLKGPTALMVSAGFAFGVDSHQAEVIPVDVAVNTLIVAAWDRAIREDVKETIVYNAMPIGCTWQELIQKGRRANRNFTYPTFGMRGMTSVAALHWIVVLLLGWLPSALCDVILSLGGGKKRIVEEHEKARSALQSLEPILSKSWPVERSRVRLLEKRLTEEELSVFPLAPEIDLESYAVCAAAAARKHCVDQRSLVLVKVFRCVFLLLFLFFAIYLIFFRYSLLDSRRIEHSKI